MYVRPGANGKAPAAGGHARKADERPARGLLTEFTDDSGHVLDVSDTEPVSAELLHRVQQIAARLAVPRPRIDRRTRRGPGQLRSRRFDGTSDELDLDESIAALVANPVPEDDDLVVRARVRVKRSIMLVIDSSGSMRGERVRTAAATVGALTGELSRDHVGVIAFWSDAVVLHNLGIAPSVETLMQDLLRIPAGGLTNVSFPLTVAVDELRRLPSRDARVVLLSDCVHNAGPDPRLVAATLPRLDVLLDATGEKDEWLGRELARVGRGRFARVTGYRDVAPAVEAFFDD